MKKLVNLKRDGQLIPKVFGGIDTKNILANGVGTYTATQDCVCCAYTPGGGYGGQVKIDGVLMNRLETYNRSYFIGCGMFIVKKGQVVKAETLGGDAFVLYVYGLKY